MGYHRAGFDVVGVDITPRPRYPFRFIQGDALDSMREMCQDVHLVHSSPPCQAHTALTKGTNSGRQYIDLIPQMRELCEWYGVDWIMENVPSAPLRQDIVLCGEMFGLGVIRHRVFETGGWGWDGPMRQPTHARHRGPVRGWRHGVWRDGPYIAAYDKGGGKGTVAEMQAAMDITWTDVHGELTEAIPPAYTEYLGREWLRVSGWGSIARSEPDAMPIPEIMRPYLTHNAASRLVLKAAT
jgi:DNA (cytosine-5)-methyltransferase 1